MKNNSLFWELLLSLQSKLFIEMEVLFEDTDLEELIKTGTNSGKYKMLARDKKFTQKIADIYNTMCSVERTCDLVQFSFLHYEKLKHIDLSSVRIFNNRVERLLFRETEKGLIIILIKLDDTHYGKGK